VWRSWNWPKGPPLVAGGGSSVEVLGIDLRTKPPADDNVTQDSPVALLTRPSNTAVHDVRFQEAGPSAISDFDE
jgi:hypothetical protein